MRYLHINIICALLTVSISMTAQDGAPAKMTPQQKAVDMAQTAMKAEEAGKADDALRNYYWALTLLKAQQQGDTVSMTDGMGQTHKLTAWIPERMDKVFAQLTTCVTAAKGQDVDLQITYQGKPVASVDYTYFDGQQWSPVSSAKDGVGVMQLSQGYQPKNLQLRYEYAYRSQAQIDPEMKTLLDSSKAAPLPQSLAEFSSQPVKAATANGDGFAQTDPSIRKAPTPVTDPMAYAKAMDRVQKAIETRQLKGAEKAFTKDGLQMFQTLIFSYGTPRILGTPTLTYYQAGDGEVVARGLQMSFTFKRGVRRSFVEDVVFTFNDDKLIDNVAFGLGKTAEDDILNNGVWSETSRTAIMNLLENYKTAYALKRLDYLQSIFDDDALIIVGNQVKKAAGGRTPENTPQLNAQDKPRIMYHRYTKGEYIKKLATCFRSNEFINIRFANNDVVKLGKGKETYAIQISQDYYSTTYGDKGYLFLWVDVNDPKQPLITLRTWQPEKDPNFGTYASEF